MAAFTTILAAVSAVATIGSTVVSVISGSQQDDYNRQRAEIETANARAQTDYNNRVIAAQNRAAEYNAQVQETNATQEKAIGEADAADYAKRQRYLMATAIARRAGSGVDVSSGSPLMVDAATAAEIELGAENLRRGGSNRATALTNEAALTRMGRRESQPYAAATPYYSGGGLAAAGTMLTGLSTLASRSVTSRASGGYGFFD